MDIIDNDDNDSNNDAAAGSPLQHTGSSSPHLSSGSRPMLFQQQQQQQQQRPALTSNLRPSAQPYTPASLAYLQQLRQHQQYQRQIYEQSLRESDDLSFYEQASDDGYFLPPGLISDGDAHYGNSRFELTNSNDEEEIWEDVYRNVGQVLDFDDASDQQLELQKHLHQQQLLQQQQLLLRQHQHALALAQQQQQRTPYFIGISNPSSSVLTNNNTIPEEGIASPTLRHHFQVP